MADDHPIAWCHEYDGGRAWYTALGHTAESWAEPAFLQHVLGGIRTAAGLTTADCCSTRSGHDHTADDSSEHIRCACNVSTTDHNSHRCADDDPDGRERVAIAGVGDLAACHDDPQRAARTQTSDNGSAAPWVALTVVVGTVALGGVAVAVVRRRRRSR